MSRYSKAAAYALVLAGFFCAAVVTRAQNREKFVISATAGGVNSVIGRVTVQSHESQPELLTAQANLKSGDIVDTGTTGRVEVLLNPGSYLRVGERSRFTLTDNSLEHLTVSLLHGSAIVEATGTDGVNTEIDINTPQHNFAIVKRGIYRINVFAGQTELQVLKGKAIVNGDIKTPLRGGHKVVLAPGSAIAAKLDKKEQDDFDSWSKNRAETLARVNRRLPAGALNSFLASFDDDWLMSRFSRRSGLWVFNQASHCYTFVPFYFGWGSPYGPAYSSLFYGNCYGCRGAYGYDRNPGIVTNTPGGNSSGPGSNPVGNGAGPSTPGRGNSGPVPVSPRNSGDMIGPRGKIIEP